MSGTSKQQQNANPIDQSLQQVFSKNDEEDDIKKAFEKQKMPRCFTKSMKDQCWNNATLFIGRHPDRWRLDAVGNPVLRALTSCLGPLCHEYDHIVPFSKGGKTEINNCQILQTMVNRYKSNKTGQSHKELIAVSSTNKFTNQEFDSIERAIYGDILKVDAEQQVKEASKQSLKILYAQKEIDQLQEQDQRMGQFEQNLRRGEESNNSRSNV